MSEEHSEQASPAQAPPLPRRKRVWPLYTVIVVLATVCTIETAYIAALHWTAGRVLGESYGGAGSTDLLALVRELNTELDKAHSQQNRFGTDPHRQKGQADPSQLGPAPGSDPGSRAPKSGRPLGPDANAALTLDDLLATVELLQKSYADAFQWLEDEPIIPQAPPRQPAERKPFEATLAQAPDSYTVRIEPKKNAVQNLTVRMEDQHLVIEGHRSGENRERFEERISFAEPVDPSTLRTRLEGGAIVVEIEKS